MVEQLTSEERGEIFLDSCEAFKSGKITEREFRKDMIRCGFNATDIEDLVRQYRPERT